MSCFRPVYAFRSLSKKTENGKDAIFFKRSEAGNLSIRITLPCGRCVGCRKSRSKEWALRCVHEASRYSENCFITLTFNDKCVNEKGTLVKSDFQKFMKRLRKKNQGFDAVSYKGKISYPIRFFHCGEYGDLMERPHHHACLFNFDFKDKDIWSIRNGVRLYRSDKLESLWPFGFCTVGDVNFQSAAYIARYCQKKAYGDDAAVRYARFDEDGNPFYIEPEYISMSRRPGIGLDWIREFNDGVFQKDFITDNGQKYKVPRYYDKYFDSVDPEALSEVKKKRLKSLAENADELNNPWRRLAIEKVVKAKLNLSKRSYEDGTTNF